MPTVLFEDNHCLVVDKPAGMLTQGDITGDQSLVDWVRDYWKVKYDKPGNVFVGLVHRLDRPTSGVVLLCRTSKAASRLSEQFRVGAVSKTYFAVCEGRPDAVQGIWEDRLIKDQRMNTVAVTQDHQEGSQVARVEFQVAFQQVNRAGVILRPLTGRGHQLRVQLASRRLPIIGDTKYGSRTKLIATDGLHRIALHAARLSFKHPTKEELCEVQAPLPSDWPDGANAFATEWSGSSKRGEPPTR